jgi:uncharacterized membrane protein required for colicin V production
VTVDLLALAYIVFSVFRGRQRGFLIELPATISIVVFALTGTGLYRWGGRVVAEANMLTRQASGVLGFFGLVAAALVLVQQLKTRLQQWAEKRFIAEHQQLGGAMAGGVRSLVVAAVLLLILAHWPLKGLTRPLAESSFFGRALIKLVLPVYDKTHSGL